MIKAIVFDFDGVIVESVEIKGDAFVELYRDEDQDTRDKILKYHKHNGGMSRFEKIRYYDENFLGKKLTQEEVNAKADIYSALVEQKVVNVRPVDGAEDFLKKHGSLLPLFVVSATPQEELVRIIEKRGYDKFFVEICGSPIGKAAHIISLLAKYSLDTSEVVMVGDATQDFIAARDTGINFVGRNLLNELSPFPAGVKTIPDLTHLEKILELS